MELRDYIRILRTHWIGALLVSITVLAFAAIWTFTRPQVYAADATGFVITGSADSPSLASVNDQLAKSRAVSYVDLATSRDVARQVKQDLRLSTDPTSLASQISVVQPPETVLIRITARAGSPDEAQRLADSWVGALADQVDAIEDPQGLDRGSTPALVPVESAELPSAPISPDPEKNLGIGLLVGLALGFAYALVRNVLDRRLRSPDAVSQRFDVNVVGVIPRAGVLGHETGEKAQLALSSGRSGDHTASEAFRKLRTNLTYMDVDNPPRVIVVTSPRPGDGKSTVALNLASAIAASGQSVTLVDADLRRPTVATSLGVVEGAGLTDVLVGRISAEDALQEVSQVPSLRVMVAGRIPPNPSELLGSLAMQNLIKELADDAFVILDAPPLLPVTDAAVLTAKADGALVVISAGQTLDAELTTSLNHLEAVQGRALGVIMNKITRSAEGYGYYGGSYGAGDKGGGRHRAGDD